MNKVKYFLIVLISVIFFNNATNAQTWNLTGNNDATAISKLGTINSQPVRVFVKNTEKMRVDSQGRVGIGITDPLSLLSVKDIGGTPVPSWLANTFPLITGFSQNTNGNNDIVLGMASSAGVGFPRLVGRKARGTLIAPAIVNINDRLLSIMASGHDGVDMQDAASIEFVVDKNPALGRVPGRIVFSTSANASNRLERMRIANNGDVTFNTNQLFLEKTSGAMAMGSIIPDTSALLDMNSTTRGMLTPRMTTAQKNAITKPAQGLLVYQTDSVNGFYYFNNEWLSLTTSTVAGGAFSNQSLSNLDSLTAVNNSLLPRDSNSIDLGSATKPWRNIFAAGDAKINGLTVGLGGGLVDGNTAIGKRTLASNTTGFSNVAIGIDALSKNPNLNNLVAIGDSALFNNGSLTGSLGETGVQNTAVGSKALFENSSGANNTAIGFNSLMNNANGFNNTAVGKESLFGNFSGSNNIAIGVLAIGNNFTGSSNIAVGNFALFTNSTGRSNIAIGFEALKKNRSGAFNVALGNAALQLNETSSSNTAIGDSTLTANTFGFFNTAIGAQALNKNASGSFNTASGSSALKSNTSGVNNTASGYFALKENSTGTNNTAVGSSALLNTTSSENTAVGTEALKANDVGFDNTAIGRGALLKSRSGVFNTAGGKEALSENVTGSFNTAFGKASLLLNTTGSNNTALGYNAFGSGNFSNSTALGANTSITAGAQVRVGSTSVTSIGGKVGWSTLSDGRFKTNVQQNIPGLLFINKLQPVSYKFNLQKLNGQLNIKNESADEKDMNTASNITYSGFIAQEVEKAAKEINYDFSGIDAPKNDKDIYGLRYAEFVVPLVKAVQELSIENARLLVGQGKLKVENEKLETAKENQAKANDVVQKQLSTQQKQIDELKDAMMKLISQQKCVSTTSK